MTWGSRRSRRALTALVVGLASLLATASVGAATAVGATPADVAGQGTSAAAGVDLTAVLAALVGVALLGRCRR